MSKQKHKNKEELLAAQKKAAMMNTLDVEIDHEVKRIKERIASKQLGVCTILADMKQYGIEFDNKLGTAYQIFDNIKVFVEDALGLISDNPTSDEYKAVVERFFELSFKELSKEDFLAYLTYTRLLEKFAVTVHSLVQLEGEADDSTK